MSDKSTWRVYCIGQYADDKDMFGDPGDVEEGGRQPSAGEVIGLKSILEEGYRVHEHFVNPINGAVYFLLQKIVESKATMQ